MGKTSPLSKERAKQVVKDILRATSRHFSVEDKLGIVLYGLRGEASVAELSRCVAYVPAVGPASFPISRLCCSRKTAPPFGQTEPLL